MALSGQDDMIMDLNAQESACFDQLLCEPQIFFTRSRIAAGVVMDKNHTRRRLQKRLPKYLPGMDNTGIKRPFRNRDFLD